MKTTLFVLLTSITILGCELAKEVVEVIDVDCPETLITDRQRVFIAAQLANPNEKLLSMYSVYYETRPDAIFFQWKPIVITVAYSANGEPIGLSGSSLLAGGEAGGPCLEHIDNFDTWVGCIDEFDLYFEEVWHRLANNEPVDDVEHITIIKTDENHIPLDPNQRHWIMDWETAPRATDGQVVEYDHLYE